MDAIGSNSSGDEYVDLDLEITSQSSKCSSLLSYSPGRRRKLKRLLGKTINEIEKGLNSNEFNNIEEKGDFKVVGKNNVKSTNQARNVPTALIANAIQFSSKIAENEDLASIKEILDLIHPGLISPLKDSFNIWFPVQRVVLPVILKSNVCTLPPRDIIISSPTGSGKTLCYVLPIINALSFSVTNVKTSAVFALVLAPVMNLAQQIVQEFEKLNVFKIRIIALVGAVDYASERSLLFPEKSHISQAHIIVATPGRLVEHLLDDTARLDLSMLRYLVIDEADRMQDTARMEWLALVEKYANVPHANLMNISSLTNCFRNRWLQRILVSATISLDVDKLHTWNLRCPQLFQANNDHDVTEYKSSIMLPDSLIHHLINCKLTFKPIVLFNQIQSNIERWNKIIVFVNKRTTGHRLAILLSKLSKGEIICAEFSSDLFKQRRLKLLKNFNEGHIRLLISSDILSRGIDIVDVDCVVNYDVPINERIFIHRAGRTARAMKEGFLLSLVTKEEKMHLKKLLTNQNLWQKIEEINVDENFTGKMTKEYEKALNSLKEKISLSVNKK